MAPRTRASASKPAVPEEPTEEASPAALAAAAQARPQGTRRVPTRPSTPGQASALLALETALCEAAQAQLQRQAAPGNEPATAFFF